MKNIFAKFKHKKKFNWTKFFRILTVVNFVLILASTAFTIYSGFMSFENQIRLISSINSYTTINYNRIRCLETGGNLNTENPQCIYAKMTSKSANCKYDNDGKIDESYWDKEAIKDCKESEELNKKLEKLYGENWFEKVFETK